MDGTATPTCPACGFLVYNRRFPRCESCNAELPESLVYSATERHALLAADEERDLERDRQERPAATSGLEESLLLNVVDLTSD